MSKKPYIIQEDSPNLIIVPVPTPTEIGYEPVPKKTKLDNDSLIQLPVQICENSASVNNASMKVKPGASCRNNSVLIDVRKLKKQPASWAANFLQSIGGSAPTTSRSYTNLATKLSLTRTENTQPNATETSTQLKPTPKPAVGKKPTLLEFNKSIQPIVKEDNQPKPNKKATQPKANQESLQLKSDQELIQLKVDKELLQRKLNKKAALTQSNRETTHSKTNGASKIIQAHKEATHPKANKEALQIKPSKERSQSKVYKEITQKSDNEDTQIVLDLYHQYPSFMKITKQKPNKTFETSAKKEDTRPKSNRKTTQTNINRGTAQPKVKKTIKSNLSTESSKPKANKATQEALQLKANKKNSKQIGNKKASQDIIHKEISKRIKSKETAEISYVKPSTVSRHQKDNIRLALKSYRINDKNRTERSPNKKIKSESSKSPYQEETKGISPIKSVVKKIKKNNNMQNKEKQFHTVSDHHLQHSVKLPSNESDTDLRSKLKRKVARDDINIKEENDIINTKKFCSNRKGFVPNENLIISFNAESDTEQVVENKPLVKTKLQKQSSKGKKSKNIKLTINLIVQDGDTTESEDDSIESCNENTDLSFLDDFNVDEIVKSLNDCQSNKAKSSTEIYLNNNTVINENDSMDSGLPTNHGKEVLHTNDGIKAEHSTQKETILTENNSSNVCKDISRKQYSADTKYLEDKNSVIQLTNRENSFVHQNRAVESEASSLGEINVNDILTNYKKDRSVEMSIKESDGNQNYIENTTNISDYVELSVKQKHTAVDPIQIHDNSVGLKPKINVCSNDDIVIFADISPKENKSMKHPNQLNAENDKLIITAKCSRTLQDNENIQPTNNNHDKHVNHNIEEKLTTQSNDVKTNDASNDQVSKCNKSLEDKELSSNVEISQVKGEVIVIEDDEYKIVEIKGQQHLLQEGIVDLTRGLDEILVTTSNNQEKNILETVKPNKIETDTKPILILDTDSDVVIEWESGLDSKEVKNGSNVTFTNVVKTTEPTENIDKLSNDVKSNNSQDNIKNSEDKSQTAGKQTHASPVDNKIVANKETASAKQKQAKINTPESKNGKPKQPTMPKQQNNGCQAQIDDNKIVEVKRQQHLLKESIVDLTRGVDGTRLATSNNQEKNIAETMKPNKIETDTDTEPILILETDYDVDIELKSSSDSKEVKNGSNMTLTNAVKTTEPTENIDKLSNDVKSNNFQNKTKNSEDKSTTGGNQKQLAKDKNDKVNNSANPVANKETASAKQNQAKTNTPESKDGKAKIEAVKPTNTNAEKQSTLPKQQNNGCQAQTVKNDKLFESNDTKLSFANRSLAKDLLARNLEERLQKYRGKSFSVTELIHKGKFSTIYCCEDGNGYKSAVKVLSDSTNTNYGKAKENMLMKLQKDVPKDNLNIVRFFYGFSLTGHWCFVMEYYPRNLFDILSTSKKSFHIDTVQHLSRQLVAAVTILRNNNIIHSEIKPRHILLNEAQTRLKLCGFDEAFYFMNKRMLPNVGSPSYRAPELILGYYADYGIDVWATAAVMYEMATSHKLFPGQFNNDILYKQLCVLDDVPNDMLQQSMFKHKHYIGNAFSRIVTVHERAIIYQFTRYNWISSSLLDVYNKEWANQTPLLKRNQDREKIAMLSKLLYQMLVMHPKHRIPIEFVFANPFIYELFEG